LFSGERGWRHFAALEGAAAAVLRSASSFRTKFTIPISAPGGDETDFEPRDEALQALERELDQYSSENYPVTDVDASADSDSFLGMDEEPA
jgi:hypothetical protein